MNKKNITFLLVLMLIMFSAVSFSSVSADDDDDDEDERSSIESREREDDDDDDEKVSAVIVEEKKKEDDDVNKDDDVETITQTVVVSPERIVIEDQLITIAVPDRDRDGIVDGEDANPDIAEIYIVKDENLNGIVDTFEYANQ